MREALKALERQRVTVTADPKSEFFGQLPDDFDDLVARTFEELDAQVTMMLVASAEAVLRKDAGVRLRERKKRDAIWAEFQARGITPDKKKVRLTDLCEAWQNASGQSKRMDMFRKLLKRRHWLAHGGTWSDKSGVLPDPMQAWTIVDDLFKALRRFQADFPRE